mgnify:FL=1
MSNAEQEEEGLAEAAVVQPQIEEEIAEIKRYEVCLSCRELLQASAN